MVMPRFHVQWSESSGYAAVVLNYGGRFDDYVIPLADDEVVDFAGNETRHGLWEDYESEITASAAERVLAELPDMAGREIPPEIRSELRSLDTRVIRAHTAATGSRYYTLRRRDGAELEVRLSDHSPGARWGLGVYVADDGDWSDVLMWARP